MPPGAVEEVSVSCAKLRWFFLRPRTRETPHSESLAIPAEAPATCRNPPQRLCERVVAIMMGLAVVAQAEVPTEIEARRVCENWLTYYSMQHGAWAGCAVPSIAAETELVGEEGTLARCYAIHPRGYILVPTLKELPPVKAYSEDSALDTTSTGGLPQLLREVLEHRFSLYQRVYGSLDARQPAQGQVLFGRQNRSAWALLAMSPDEFSNQQNTPMFGTATGVGPLLETAWSQSAPYNNFCPLVEGVPTYVGCVPTAAAQILRYHRWPAAGIGSHTYHWGGAPVCGEYLDEWLSAEFSDPYDWENMPAVCTTSSPPTEQDAVAELGYEVAVAFEAVFGTCGTAAQPNATLSALPIYFRYDTAIDRQNRDEHTADSWFGLIQTELDAGRVMLYALSGHAVVCDGWRLDGTLRQYHMNYGWGGPYDAWYVIDELYCTSPWGCDPMQELVIRNIMPDADCNDNGVPDEQDVASGASEDCNGNNRPDECDLALGVNRDCNENGVLDVCDIGAGASADCNSNGWPDECDGVGYGDFDARSGVDLHDFQALAACAAGPGTPIAVPDASCMTMYLEAFDFDADDDVDLADYGKFMRVFGLTGPVAGIWLFWDFDDNGAAWDRSDHGHHGVVHGALPLGSPFGEWSLWFDGVDDFVEVLDTADFAFAGESFTLAAQVKIVDNPDEFRFFVDISDTDMVPGVRIAKLPNRIDEGRLYAELCAASGACTQVVGINDGETLLAMPDYLLVVAVVDWDSYELAFYVDGIEQGRSPLVDVDLPEAGDLKVRIGCSASDSCYHLGGINDVRVYRRALREWDVVQLCDVPP